MPGRNDDFGHVESEDFGLVYGLGVGKCEKLPGEASNDICSLITHSPS